MDLLGWRGVVYWLDFAVDPPDSEYVAWVTLSDPSIISRALRFGQTLLGNRDYDCLTSNDRQAIRRYCPMCLEEDTVPYLRITWRLATTVICDKHKIAMQDRCPHCGCRLGAVVYRRLVSHYGRPTDFHRYCLKCGGDLTIARKILVPPGISVRLGCFQKMVWGAICTGHFAHPRYGSISPHKLMDIFLIRNKSHVCKNGRIEIIPGYYGVNWKIVMGEKNGLWLDWIGVVNQECASIFPPSISPP